MTATGILWGYIVLLVAGGLVGYLMAGSKASIVAAAGFGILLSLCNTGIIPGPYVADILLTVLLVIFALRYARGKKFMPSGLMAVLTAATLVLRQVVER